MNKKGYITVNSKKGRIDVDDRRGGINKDIFLIKAKGTRNIGTIELRSITFPEQFIGKRIRLKVEFVKRKQGEWRW